MKTPPALLLVCDGWGHAPPSEGNAISRARTPIYDRWLAEYPWTLLEASGEAVGLPDGVMGNSEVGHLTLGAGRMVPQDLLRIDLGLRDRSFFTNPALVAAPTRKSWSRSRSTVTGFQISKMSRAFSGAFWHSAKAVGGSPGRRLGKFIQ